MTWSAKQYSTFEAERTRPVRDLVAAIATAPVRSAIDLGCGPGNSTEVLAARFPEAAVSGMDSSDDMVAAARERLPSLHFDRADIASWNPAERYDVILANASLQWVPDHAALYPRLAGRLNPGGTLAVQTPDNLGEPAHVLMRAVAADGPWAGVIGDTRHPMRHPAEFYYALLQPHCSHVDVWRTTYFHPLAGGAEAVVEWFKGTALRPYLQPLSKEQQAGFLARYTEAVAEAYPALPDGTVLLPFPRLFIIATR
ncbi:MAG: trans-aconitate 2-methyltransferase [Rhodoferax sp.]|nr:trans-aconitate 2-methyltransferase [Rhodoferax sp.]